MPKTTAKKSDKLTKEGMAAFIENVNKKGTELNGRRIAFHFVRRKRKAY